MAKIKTEPLTRAEFSILRGLQDPLIDFMIINALRRNEIVQIAQNWDGKSDYVIIRPKKQLKTKIALSKKEIELLPKIDKMAIKNKKNLNNYFVRLSAKVGFHVHPHKLRTTAATYASRLGVPGATIQKLMNHKNYSDTEKYIKPSFEDVLDAKETISEIATVDGWTIHEWRKNYFMLLNRIHLLEELNNEK